MNNDFPPPWLSDGTTDPVLTEDEVIAYEQRRDEYIDRLIDEQDERKQGQCYIDDLPLSKVENTMVDFFTKISK